MYRTIKQSFEFLLVLCLFFVGDYSDGSFAILPILVFLTTIVFIWDTQSITLRELTTLFVIIVYFVCYFIAHSGVTKGVPNLIKAS